MILYHDQKYSLAGRGQCRTGREGSRGLDGSRTLVVRPTGACGGIGRTRVRSRSIPTPSLTNQEGSRNQYEDPSKQTMRHLFLLLLSPLTFEASAHLPG